MEQVYFLAQIPREILEKAPVLAIILHFCFKIIPALIAALSIYLGYKLFISGVTGRASLSVKTNTVSGQLLNAAPGLFFGIGGIVALMVIVWRQ